MAKNLKINIKNTQIAEAINLGSLKNKLAKKKEAEGTVPEETAETKAASAKEIKKTSAQPSPAAQTPAEEPPPRIRARSKSAFGEGANAEAKPKIAAEPQEGNAHETSDVESDEEGDKKSKRPAKKRTSEELRKEIFGEEIAEQVELKKQEENKLKPSVLLHEPAPTENHAKPSAHPVPEKAAPTIPKAAPPKEQAQPAKPEARPTSTEHPKIFTEPPAPVVKLGPTGRHIKDLLPPKPQPKPKQDAPPPHHARQPERTAPHQQRPGTAESDEAKEKARQKAKGRGKEPGTTETIVEEEDGAKKAPKAAKFKEFRDIKPPKRQDTHREFDVRDRHGLRVSEEENTWRKKRSAKHRPVQEEVTIRPTSLKVRIPISIKDLASEMKLKSSQLVQKLFLQGVIVTLNDLLEDETTIQLLGHEFGCEIAIDTTEEERLRITDKTISEEISETDEGELRIRPPVVAFMGHVDHGKTSLIDTIRKSNRVAGEAGAITQHIGAFRCHTAVGDIAILDTPGHEAFSAMRARGADVTDIVVLVIAGDEGIRQQTVEAIQHAKAAEVTIVVALNKCDKPNFNAENVYRQLADHELLPESWGGQTITVNCSAVTGQGIPQLLEMLALQAEILELKANPNTRARGSVLESEMHKGMGAVATVLVQNGTLKLGDALVFGDNWGRVKTMRDEFSRELTEAGPSTPVEITGMSGLPEAGEEFIVVKTEREAREIAEARLQGSRQFNLQQKKKVSMENLLQQATESPKKILNIVLRADVQGSLEALKIALEKIHSDKADLNIIFTGVGEITESDAQLAAASRAVIIGFHTAIESHADALIRQLGVQVRLHDIIYHAIDDVKELMVGLLDKIAQETDKGKAEVKATFKSSQVGVIAGCQVIEGSIVRNNHIRIRRNNEIVWKGSIASLKRVKEDVREVQKGLECGILLNGYNGAEVGDILEAYEVTYITQQL